MNDATREPASVGGDEVNGVVVMVIALGTLIVMGLGVAVAWELASSGSGADIAAVPARFGSPPADMNAIEMSLFPPRRPGAPLGSAGSGQATERGEDSDQSRAERRLRSYGWNSREQGTLHIPIARAMQLYIAREARAGGTAEKTPSSPGPRARGTP